MSYEIVRLGGHKCDLPDADAYPELTVIECTTPMSGDSHPLRCGKRWINWSDRILDVMVWSECEE